MKRSDFAKHYRVRSRALKKLGFATYQQYLQSPLWAEIRERVLRRSGWKCFACKGVATQVHHKKYTIRTLSGAETRTLAAICRPCHQLIEFDGEQKVDLRKANWRLQNIRDGKPADWRPPKLPPVDRIPPESERMCENCKSNAVAVRALDNLCGRCRKDTKGRTASQTDMESSAFIDLIAAQRLVTITDSLIDAGASDAGGWSESQLRLLGVMWPPQKGWRERMIGRRKSGAAIASFLRLKSARIHNGS